MTDTSETKVTRRNAILTTGKAAIAFGAAALFAGRLPKIQPLDGGDSDSEDKDMDEESQPTGGLATAAVQYTGTDDDETVTGNDIEDVLDTDESGGFSSNFVDLGLVPIQFVISQIDTTTLGTPVGGPLFGSLDTVSVMSVSDTRGGEEKRHFVHVWADQQGHQAILPAFTSSGSPTRPIVVGTSVDVEALEDAIRSPPLSLGAFTINNSGSTYLLLAFGSRSEGPPQDEDSDGD